MFGRRSLKPDLISLDSSSKSVTRHNRNLESLIGEMADQRDPNQPIALPQPPRRENVVPNFPNPDDPP